MSKPFVSSTLMKPDKSNASLLTTYTEVPCDDLEAGIDDISVCIKVREITPGLEDSGSNSSSEGSSNMLFNSFIQIHSGMSDFYKSNRPHIKMIRKRFEQRILENVLFPICQAFNQRHKVLTGIKM
ncbi:uncharacterized protein LOC144621309 [Crassostrea virginica]